MLPPTIRELLSRPPPLNSVIKTFGHVRAVRKSKNIGFVDLTDGTGHQSLNVVFKDPSALANTKVGQSVSVVGQWCESAKKQTHEVVVTSQDALTIVGDVPNDYPIQKKATSVQFLRQHPTLRHRTAMLASMLRFRSLIEAETMSYFHRNGFTKVAPPIITGADCEGAGEQFQLVGDFFGKPVGLTVSTQLHLEVLSQSMGRVWTLTPCFRAEASHTNRHLSEFWMLEAEISWIDSLSQLMSFTEDMIREVTEKVAADSDVLESRYDRKDVEVMKARWATVLGQKWPRITYREAIQLVNDKSSLEKLSFGDDLSTAHEKWLAGSHFCSPVFVTNYPREQKPFYMPVESDGTVACFDLLLPDIGELVGGSMREHRLEELVGEMERRGMNIEDMEWYLSTRRNGTLPHGGFGMGFERLVAYLGGMESVREVIPFPRAPEYCQC